MNTAHCLSQTGGCRRNTLCGMARPCASDSMLPAEYTRFSLDWADAYRPLFAAMPTHPLAFSLPNLWAWQEWMDLEIRFSHGLAWLRCLRHGPRYLAPVGSWHDVDWSALQGELKRMGTVHQVPEPLARIWEAELSCPVDVAENRDFWEYLYTADDLAKLAGKRYHMQRNHVNAYIREHGEPDVRDLDGRDTPAMLALAAHWHEAHEKTPLVLAELDSLSRICAKWDQLCLIGKGVYLGEQLVAFSIGHILDDTTTGVMYEKAEPGVRGAFPVMASAFARTAAGGRTLLNRAEDMGEAGMRNAKMLYRPVDFQRMCTVRIDP